MTPAGSASPVPPDAGGPPPSAAAAAPPGPQVADDIGFLTLAQRCPTRRWPRCCPPAQQPQILGSVGPGPMILTCSFVENPYLREAHRPPALGGGWGIWCEGCKEWAGTDHENSTLHLAVVKQAPPILPPDYNGGGYCAPPDSGIECVRYPHWSPASRRGAIAFRLPDAWRVPAGFPPADVAS